MPTHVSKTILLKPARKAFDKMDMKTRKRLIDGIKGLEQIPAVGDIKPLSGIIGKYRLRIGSYRVIYSYGTDSELIILYVEDIGSRGDIYK